LFISENTSREVQDLRSSIGNFLEPNRYHVVMFGVPGCGRKEYVKAAEILRASMFLSAGKLGP
jgi:hypothetical protein